MILAIDQNIWTSYYWMMWAMMVELNRDGGGVEVELDRMLMNMMILMEMLMVVVVVW